MSTCAAAVYGDPVQRRKFEMWADYSFHAIGFDPGDQRDKALCLCGWSGTPYWDGVHKAWIEWYKHVKKSVLTEQANEQREQ